MDIQEYVAKTGRVSLNQLENHFRMNGDAIRAILKKLIKKGRVKQLIQEKCHGCTCCSDDIIEFYVWNNPTLN